MDDLKRSKSLYKLLIVILSVSSCSRDWNNPVDVMPISSDSTPAQNLIENPNAEQPLVGGEIPSWSETVGSNWKYRFTDPQPYAGQNYFFAGVGANAELSQDVDVARYVAEIDNETQLFIFSGYVRSYPQTPADEARIIVEYRDVLNSIVLASYDSGLHTNVSSWNILVDQRTAPIGTRIIRIRLISTRQSGNNNDGYFDELSLIAETPK